MRPEVKAAPTFAKWSMDFGGSKGTWVEFQSGAAVNHSLLGGSSSPISRRRTDWIGDYGARQSSVVLTSANNVYLVTSDASSTTFSGPEPGARRPDGDQPVTDVHTGQHRSWGSPGGNPTAILIQLAESTVDPPRDSGTWAWPSCEEATM